MNQANALEQLTTPAARARPPVKFDDREQRR